MPNELDRLAEAKLHFSVADLQLKRICRDQIGRFSSCGGGAAGGAAGAFLERSRKQALDEAKELGFEPTSRDKWINEQQGIEYMERYDRANLLQDAKEAGYKPTSSDDFIVEQQAREHLDKIGHGNPKVNLEEPIMAELVEESTAKKWSGEQMASHVESMKGIPERAWSNYQKIEAKTSDWYTKHWGNDKVVKQSVQKTLDNLFTKEKLASRLWTEIFDRIGNI